MRTLAIDTATAACSVALFEGDRLIAHVHEVVGRGHAERLVPMIATLPDAGRAPRILVDCGPGSFTGIRVGLAAARALGLAWRAEVAGYSALALIAAAAPAGRLAVAIGGGHGEWFVQCFDGPPVAHDGELVSLPPERALAMIGDRPLHGDVHAAQPALPDARNVMMLPAAVAALPPVPIYGRAPDAKVPT